MNDELLTTKKMIGKFNVVVEKDEYGYYAYCPELEGCQTQGDTLEETLDNIKEAIELYLTTLSDVRSVPSPLTGEG